MKQPADPTCSDVLNLFSNPAATWFRESFGAPTEIQDLGWAAIARNSHALLTAPTGSGKTLAAFFWSIDCLGRAEPESVSGGVQILYVSPLKALVYDVERNLRAPLVGVERTAARLGQTWAQATVDVRTGDTPQKERRRQAREPGQILVTTPESLYLILGSKAGAALSSVRTVIIDEIHALAGTKRGVHLALTLERLSERCQDDPQRLGLSATVRPVHEVSAFLGGDREVTVIDTVRPARLDLSVTVPVPDMERTVPVPASEDEGGSILGELYAREVGTPRSERGIWPAIYPRLLQTVQDNRATLIFVNNRGLCERLAQRLNELAEEELVLAHHGSVSHERRQSIEEGLKAGLIRGIVATSSLELGIDMGAVDRVVMVESPGSVARGLQRAGRAGHGVGEVSVARVYPKFRGDLLESTVIGARMISGELEAIHTPRNVLDVLSQQLVAMCCDRSRPVAELLALVRRAYPYRGLSLDALHAVLDMLSGRYPSAEFAELRPLLNWDRSADILTPRKGAPMVTRVNAGTIPDRGNYPVHLGPDGPRVGELDEEMVFETRTGETILLGASTWRVEEISRDRVLVSPAPGEPGRLPFWRGEGPGRPIELGRAIGAFVRELAAHPPSTALDYLRRVAPLDQFAAENLLAYVTEQVEHNGCVPSDRAITVERFRDELGDWRVCILSPFGARIHAPWAMAIEQGLVQRSGFEVQVMYTDDGIVLRFADAETPPELDALLPEPEDLEEQITERLAQTALFAGLFRENAVRSLILTRKRPGERSPLWAQRIRARNLLATVQRHPSFPVVLETYRQCLSDVFDLPGLKALLGDVRSRRVRVQVVDTASASPFARSLVFAYVAAYIYEQDAPLAERRAQALTLDRALLGELLGQAQLRELIDPQVLAELEDELQCRAPDRQARDMDELHDLLRRLGDLSEAEVMLRSGSQAPDWLVALADRRRAVALRFANGTRWVAAEDAGLYRDAFGVMPPSGLPDRFLEPVPDALGQVLRRFARTHGPFETQALCDRYGFASDALAMHLSTLEHDDILVQGEIRPGGCNPEWCDTDVLRRLKRMTVARLRNQVAPVEAATLGCFLPSWHALDQPRAGMDGLREALIQLEGLALPWSALQQVLLPRRVSGFEPGMLDMLAATGEMVWVGVGPLGARDARIAVYRRERLRLLVESPEREWETASIQHTLIEHLTQRGASFLSDLQQAVSAVHPGSTGAEFRDALWDLVWASQISNDTFQPLRGLAAPTHRRRPTARGGNALAGGRWFLLSQLLDPSVSATERLMARAECLMERYGVVSREAAHSESVVGGFSGLYQVLKAMEDTGRVRRGYFVEGLSGAQFGHVGVIDRLRACRPDDAVPGRDAPALMVLAAVDPANPYGALLAWPETDSPAARPKRVPGAWVFLADGLPVLYVAANARHLLTFQGGVRGDSSALGDAFTALRGLPRNGRRLPLIEKVNGLPVLESPMLDLLLAAGFRRDYRGLMAIETDYGQVG